MTLERIEAAHLRLNRFANVMGSLLVDAFHQVARVAGGGTSGVAAAHTFAERSPAGHASIDDILLLFIYLELGAMVGIYFTTQHMPVRFLIYVSITALTRMLIASIQHDHTPTLGILLVSGGILILAIAALVIRFGSHRYPSPPHTPPHQEAR